MRAIFLIALLAAVNGRPVPAVAQQEEREAWQPQLPAGSRIEKNIPYGYFSGLALLMDVYRPARPNGLGVLQIGGSGWQGRAGYDSPQLKSGGHMRIEGYPLLAAGYTVFSVNHRGTPTFPFPAPVEDVQRAVRFIRHHAREYGIDPQRIGAVGGSSGGHLASMLGVLDGRGDPLSRDPVGRESAKVQAVVARATPSDLSLMPQVPQVQNFVGRINDGAGYQPYAEASPASHVTADDPPFLLVHGDVDETIPLAQAERFEQFLAAQCVEVKLLRIQGGTHGPSFGDPEKARQYGTEIVRWFDGQLHRPEGAAAPPRASCQRDPD